MAVCDEQQRLGWPPALMAAVVVQAVAEAALMGVGVAMAFCADCLAVRQPRSAEQH
jgi:hypothetical protein